MARIQDSASNITTITDTIDPARSQGFAYDALFRLTQGIGAYGTIDYAYDAVGNRLTRTITAGGATTETSTYDVASNRLETVFDGTDTRTLTYDASGNTTVDNKGGGGPVLTIPYNDAGRPASVSDGGGTLATYGHNAIGQRVLKDAASVLTHYQYDRSGALIAEHDATGAPLRETIRLGGVILTVVEHAGTPVMYYAHPDHLGSPQKMTDAAMSVVWDGRFRPFGEEHLITGTLTQDDRFPGQRLEAETGYSYNYFREYDPATGRC